MTALTLYFDGNCAFCQQGMASLRRWDSGKVLAYIDIAAPGFDPAPLGVTLSAMNRELHALRADGVMLVGTDSILEAYTLAGRPWLVWPLRVPLLRPMLAAAYRSFARNRYRISRWLRIAPAAQCDGACDIHLGGKHGT